LKLQTVVADDEPLARERILRFIADDPELELASECRNGKEVREVLLTRKVDLLLLDIQMPGLTGLEVVKEMNQRRLPMIIFVTAHDQYAPQAFDIHALDYLLKPIEPLRFQEAVRRVKEFRQMELAMATQTRFETALAALESLTGVESSRPVRFVVRSGVKDVFVGVADITWIEAADYYVCLHVSDRKHMLRESIRKLEAQLDPRKFVRVHRSAIVNIDCVCEIHREGRSEGWTLLSNGDRVRMSTQGWQKLLAAGKGS
jgi:two-component system, LytTR family, response regulator